MDFYGRRYMQAKEFARYYHDVAEPRTVSHSSKRWLKELEFWEQQGLLHPRCRVVLPEEYCRFFAEHDHRQSEDRILPDDWPEKWRSLFAFFEDERLWRAAMLPQMLSDDSICLSTHPFDRDHDFGEFIVNPRCVGFQAWDSYEFGMSVGKDGWTETRADHLYHYWQVHYLDAVRRENSTGYFAKRSDIWESWQAGDLPRERLGTRRALYGVGTEELARVETCYDALSQYVVARDRQLSLAFQLAGEEEAGVLTLAADAFQDFRTVCVEHAVRIHGAFRLSEEQVYDLLESLCRLYFDYRGDERGRMADVLQNDIARQIDLISDATDADGEVIFDRVKDLREVFVDILEEAKHRARRTLTSRMEEYNKVMPSKYQANEQDISELCDYCQDAGLSLLLETIKEVNWDWHHRNAFTANDLFTHLRNAAVVVEDLVKHIGGSSQDEEMRLKFLNAKARNQTFHKSLRRMFSSAKWWQRFKEEANRLSEIRSTDVPTRLEGILNTGSLHTVKWMSFVIRMFLVAQLSRNLAAHRARPPKDLFPQPYVSVMHSLLYAIIFVWMNAKVKGLFPDKVPG